MFGLVSKARFDDVNRRYDENLFLVRHIQREAEYLRAECKRLVNIIIDMKFKGMEAGPGAGEEPWPEGKYNMEEMEQLSEASPPEVVTYKNHNPVDDMDIAAEIAADLKRAFPDED